MLVGAILHVSESYVREVISLEVEIAPGCQGRT